MLYSHSASRGLNSNSPDLEWQTESNINIQTKLDVRALEMQINDLILRRIATHTGDSLTQTLTLWIKEWLLAIYRSALALPRARIIATRNSSVGDDTVVPERHTARLPFPAYGQIVGRVQVLA